MAPILFIAGLSRHPGGGADDNKADSGNNMGAVEQLTMSLTTALVLHRRRKGR